MMVDYIIKAGLAAGYLTYLLVQSSASPSWWRRFVGWWAGHTPWEGKPFSCMVCMSFWTALILLIPSYGLSLFTSIFQPCTAPQCLIDGSSRYWFEVWYNAEGLVIATFAVAGISTLFCYIIDKLSMTYITVSKPKSGDQE